MGLRDLRTDLKSLRYSGDTLGGGTSNQPYIKAKIPDGFNDLQNANNDFILRGGILAARDSATDVLRLGKMFIDTKSPSGLLFIAKQQLLSRIAVRTQTSGKTLNEGVYSPLNTLAEAGLVAFGGHLVKQGINPFASTGVYSTNNSLYGVRVKNTQAIDENRLVRLASNKETKLNGITLNDGNDGVNIMTYSGGPGAPLGIGKTGIRFADQRTGINNSNGKKIVAGTYQTTRPSGRTSSDIISPITRGVSGKYLDYIKGNLFNNPLTFPDGDPIIILSGYGYVRRNSNNVYQSGSLKLDNQVVNSQKTLKSVDYNPVNPEKSVQQGGLKINTDTPWNASSYGLPSVNINSPQNASLDYANNTQPQPQGTWVYNQPLISAVSQSAVGSARVGAPIIQDFRAILREKLKRQDKEKATQSGATPVVPAYSGPDSKAYENRVNIGGTINGISSGGGPGNKTNKNLTSYTKGSGIGPIDRINALNLYSNDLATTDVNVNDLVKFRIAAISNKTPTLKTFMHFRAFIDNFSDSYNATWAPINYLGRGESFYTYNGFTRTISLGWTVAAQSKEELMPMYRKLNYLASTLTPDYTSNGYMAGNLVQLTIGGYLYEQVGFINSLTYDIPMESPWEIGINDEGNYDSTTKEMPHILKVTGFSFTPIHEFIPSKQRLDFTDNIGLKGNVTGFRNQKYIALANTENDGVDGGYRVNQRTVINAKI
jgi:hypothetical protein